MASYSEAELAKVLSENDSERVQLVCGKHSYMPTKTRANGVVAVPPNSHGCKNCWFAYYAADLALTPPSKRQERLDELEAVIHHAIEYERSGKFGQDFELFEPAQDSRFTVEHQKDAADDATGEDKVVIPGEESLN